MISSETHGSTSSVDSLRSIMCPARSARSHPRADRPQRRRQNDVLQPCSPNSLSPTRRTAFNGIDITGDKPAQISAPRDYPFVPDFAVFPHLTVLENVRIGLQRQTGMSFHFWKSEKILIGSTTARDLPEQVDLGSFADVVTASLPYGRKRALEIATTLAMEPEGDAVDEPTQGISTKTSTA